MTYVTIEELRDQVQISDLSAGSELTIALDAAVETIDGFCNRTFTVPDLDQPPETRTYSARTGRRVVIHDLAVLDQVEYRASSGSAFELIDADVVGVWPEHADIERRPFTELRRAAGFGSWSTHPLAVRVTGWWGWPQVPGVVRQATLLQASRFFQRRSAQFGVAPVPGLDGSGMRLLAKLDADVELMLTSVRRDPTRCP